MDLQATWLRQLHNNLSLYCHECAEQKEHSTFREHYAVKHLGLIVYECGCRHDAAFFGQEAAIAHRLHCGRNLTFHDFIEGASEKLQALEDVYEAALDNAVHQTVLPKMGFFYSQYNLDDQTVQSSVSASSTSRANPSEETVATIDSIATIDSLASPDGLSQSADAGNAIVKIVPEIPQVAATKRTSKEASGYSRDRRMPERFTRNGRIVTARYQEKDEWPVPKLVHVPKATHSVLQLSAMSKRDPRKPVHALSVA